MYVHTYVRTNLMSNLPTYLPTYQVLEYQRLLQPPQSPVSLLLGPAGSGKSSLLQLLYQTLSLSSSSQLLQQQQGSSSPTHVEGAGSGSGSSMIGQQQQQSLSLVQERLYPKALTMEGLYGGYVSAADGQQQWKVCACLPAYQM